MEIFMNLWNNWTNIEKINTLSLYLSLLILLPLLVKIITKNNKLFIFSILSLLSSALITLLGITFLSVAFNYTITYIFLLTPIIVVFINLLNVGSSIGYYQLNKRDKNFSMNDLKREYIQDSIYLTIFLVLLFSALSIFITSTFLTFILLTGATSVAIIWVNYALLYYTVK
jgi:hypothetical protein